MAKEADVPITLNGVVKWTGISVATITTVISVVWFFAVLKGDIASLRQEVAAMKHENEVRNAQQDKDIERLTARADKTDTAVADLGRKLDVAVTILERIDQKVNKP